MKLALDSGHEILCCPSGKTPKGRVNTRRSKYSTLPKFGNGVCVVSRRPMEEGRIAIVTNAGRTAVDVDYAGAKGVAGRATVSDRRRANDRCDPRTAKSCRPDARRLCVKSCGDGCGPTGPAHQPSATATGATVHRSPGRARHKPFQPSRREGRDAPVALWFSACAAHADYSVHRRPWEPIGSRPSLRPLSIEGKAIRQDSGGQAARMRSRVSKWECELKERARASHAVIASAAKQSRIFPRMQSGLLRRKSSSQ